MDMPPSAAAEASRDPIVRLQGVNKWYDDFHALLDINLAVGRGEKVVVCGPSGSGKSTMIRCINRLEQHQQGSIVVDGIEVRDDRRALEQVRRNVGMVFQSINLFPHLTVMENLTLGSVCVNRTPRGDAETYARTLLERVGIPDKAWNYPGQLSGGQQQRVAIVRALMSKPKVLLFDEPTSALDPEMINEVLRVMIEVAESGMTMIVVTHEMGFARKVADLVVFMDGGRIVEATPPEEFFERAQTERARLFLSQVITH